MKPPPLLLGATLAFWGWQSEFLLAGVLMAVIVESARFVPGRWEFSDGDFSRVWTFCSLLFLAAGVYAFTANEGPSTFGSFFTGPSPNTQTAAGNASAKTAAAMFRWLPMLFFPFLAAQLFSTRETIPLATISLLLRRRQRQAKQAGQPVPASRNVNLAWPYFVGTLLAASVHPAENNTFFWGLAALLTWALWSQRSRRFAFVVWLVALAAAIALGYGGQHGYGLLQKYVQGLNPEWLVRFLRRDFDPENTRTALGSVGEVKTSGRIVIRLWPKNGAPVPTYLREASYRFYKQPTWSAGSASDFQAVAEELPVNSGNWPLLPEVTNRHTVNIACYLDNFKGASRAGLLPLPAGSGRLEKLPAYVLGKNLLGAVFAEGPGLVIFDAIYDSGKTIDSPPEFGSTNESRRLPSVRPVESGVSDATNQPPARGNPNNDLEVPPNERPALDAVIAELQLRGLPRGEVLRRLAGYFADQFTYRTWQPYGRFATNETALSRFLTQSRAGHCEYFATAATLLLRQLEIPARYAVGFAVHETSGRGYVVRLRDAHAWTLVWNEEKKVWDDFDTTPASWIKEEGKHASAFQWLSDVWTRLGYEFARLRWGQTNLRNYLLMAIVPGLAVLLYQIIFRRGRRRKKAGAGAALETFDWPGLDSEFYQLEKQLAGRGVPRAASEPLNEWLTRVATTPGLAELCAPLQEILRLHYRYRFDPLGLGAGDREILQRDVKSCLEVLHQMNQPVMK